MKKIFSRLTAYLILALTPLFVFAQEEQKPAVVFMGDRTIIYVDRLALQGDETIMDVLQIYPEVFVKGFDNLLENYQLRMDNTFISCDVRQYLSTTPVRNVRTIQIVETPSVAKGVTGTGGVIDLNMHPNEEGTHGFVGLELNTKGGVSPLAAINSGIKHPQGSSTDIYASASYNDRSRHGDTNLNQYATANISHRFGDKDRTILFLRQGYGRMDFSPVSSSDNRSYLAHLYHYHTFNDIGTMLLLVAGYRYDDNVAKTELTPSFSNERVTTGMQTYVAELNTPLPFLGGAQLMVGWEGDFAHIPYQLRHTLDGNANSPTGAVQGELSFNDKYTISVNDFYLMLDYRLGPVVLSAGDRVSVYHYGMDASGVTASHNPVRHTPMGTIVATLAPSHQLRGGYARRFVNPSLFMELPTSYPTPFGTWQTYTTPVDEDRADIYSLAYTYSRGCINGNLSSKYVRFTNIDNKMLQVNAAVDWRRKCFALTAGATLCHTDKFGEKKTYAYIRLAPTVRLPHEWRIGAKALWWTAKAPEYSLYDNVAVYTDLTVEKTFARHIALSAQWHDIFNSNYSAAFIMARYKF